MLRSVAVIAWAIGISNPSLSSKTRTAYAKIIQTEAKDRRIDPFTIVAIVHNESRWRAGAISRDGEDYGLGQIRARFVGACRKDADPVNKPSPACKAAKASLLNGAFNLRAVARHITEWRRTCRRITKRPALFARWLHGYGGMGNLKRGIICGQKKTRKGWRDLPIRRALRRIMDYRKRLIRDSRKRHKRRRRS